ncbi:D-galactarate dehydratase [Sulfolobus sp. A20]|uniref:UxaA family hydrolase n=1 Tax=Saccharolobus sp. A20 TaxID=1891280 RepID=UPI0008461494|nr:UxaA family hydrolase [Sulfolobus sp. A20]TRM76740.1 D-galactarate dehydratase [Sulfolobus sp. E5]TRM77729.1 D-galactarate dehydratase [Sulfolobus sp. B5]TRM78072.1 D-galactarate dehydratase [Sulfolobus sp. A20-N-F8]TRM82403.1 D-galactarate dehydratase [Sulfolobus sp. D5]TRM83495.1 D-galactarate dehydratase [Sulfolobus sp. F3]TRM88776.1 D-galactarate dehydratase [Sulfolobus sp. C3]TRN00938.1 D-galactarate dehydratase [Sulfolobus sp. E1]
MITIKGYLREDGSVGIRNHVLILPLDDLSNTASIGVAKLIRGTIAVPHPYGRLQFGKDLDLLFHVLSGTGANPNVASVIIIGIEENWANKVADEIAKTGKPVEVFPIEGYGDLRTIERASRKAKEFVQEASEKQRTEVDISSIVMSTKCGESDTTSGLASNPAVGVVIDRMVDLGATAMFGETSELTGGEDIVASKIKDEVLREKFWRIYKEYVNVIESQGVDLLGSQPTQGNIKGGLSTIEEKALGNIQKLGHRPINCVLDYLDKLDKKKEGGRLCFVNTSSAAAEAVTLFAAKGSVIHLFTTGQGNIVGHPIIPVIKITANPKTVKSMSEHIDVDISDLLSLKISLEEAGERIFNYMLRVINGRLTSAEVLQHDEFSPIKLYISA